MSKLQTLKGFRDFLPKEAIIRKQLVDKITSIFETFGFDPLETPALEYAEVLLGKYGDEADKLLYLFKDRGDREVGLRYDQTVPLARIISQYRDIPKPFKRYQVQPVWRAENTQKGRYREFLQCDADIIGDSNKAVADAELLSLFWNIYKEIGFKDVVIQVNSRVVLKKLINDSVGDEASEKDFLSIVRSLDKLDKIGKDGVREELLTKKVSTDAINSLFEKMDTWTTYSYTDVATEFGELGSSLQMAVENFGIPVENIQFNPTLARGLDYYTGIIFESTLPGIKGSLGGGGRYDNLIKQFIGEDIAAVGFAVGFDRTLEAALEQNLIDTKTTVTQVLIAIKDDKKGVFPAALNLTSELRSNGIKTELYLDPTKDLGKQFKYADNKGIPYVIVLGPDEVEKRMYKLKNMKSGEESEYDSMKNLLESIS